MFGQVRGYLPAKTIGQSIFMQDQNPAGFFNAGFNSIFIPGLQAAQIDNLDRQVRVFFSIVQRPMNAKSVGDDTSLCAFLYYPGFPYFNGVCIISYIFADAAVQVLVLEIDNRVGVINGRQH